MLGARFFDAGQTDSLDQLGDPDESGAHVGRQHGQLGVNGRVQRFDCPDRARDAVMQPWYDLAS